MNGGRGSERDDGKAAGGENCFKWSFGKVGQFFSKINKCYLILFDDKQQQSKETLKPNVDILGKAYPIKIGTLSCVPNILMCCHVVVYLIYTPWQAGSSV